MLNIIVNAAFASALVAAAPSTYRDEDVNPYMPKKLRGNSASAGLGGDGAKLRVRVSLEAPPKIEEGGAPEANILRNINPTADTSDKTQLGFDSSEELGHLDNYVVQENAVGNVIQAIRIVNPASDIIEKIPSGFDPSEELGYLENTAYSTTPGQVLVAGTGFHSTEDVPMFFFYDYEADAPWYEGAVLGNLNFYTGKAIDNLTDGAHEVEDSAENLRSDEILIERALGKDGYNFYNCGGNYPLINKSGSGFEYLVYACTYNFNCPYNVPFGCWDTSQVTDMSLAFAYKYSFNEDISFWNTSGVTDFERMFDSAYDFNQDIGDWDVSTATDMSKMFRYVDFNQPVGVWDVANVTNMYSMFKLSGFNQPLDNWDVGKVTGMFSMFLYSEFNQCLSSWANEVPDYVDVDIMFSGTGCLGPETPQSNVSPWCQTIEDGCDRGCGGYYPLIYQSGSDFENLVFDCIYYDCPYNVPIGCWETSRVTDMSFAFKSFTYFNEDISFWNTSGVKSFSGTFNYAPNFNQIISYWDVSAVTSMSNMFIFSFDFNQPIGAWDVANVTNMYATFASSGFNRPLDNWDVGNVKNMDFMFYVSGFNQCLSSWANKVPDYVDVDYMFSRTGCLGPETPQSNVSPWCQTIEDGCGYAVATESPTKNPTESPTKNPTESPTKNPTESPTGGPTKNSLCKNNLDQFTFTAELTCEEVASAGRKLRNDLCNNLQGNIKASCPNACELMPSEDNTNNFTFTSETTCDEILSTNVSKKTIAILCDDPFGLALNCPQFCPATDTCPCVDSIVPFKIPGGITSCSEVDSSEDKDKFCKKRKIKGMCRSVCATPGCD